MEANELLRRALAVNQELLALGNEVFQVDGTTFVRNRRRSRIYDANHVAGVRARSHAEIDHLLDRVRHEYAGFAHVRFDIDASTPPEFEARLAAESYQRSEALVLLLDGPVVGRPRPHDVRPVESDATWSHYAALQEVDWQGYRERLGQPLDRLLGRHMAEIRREKSPPARHWLAYVGGQPAAYLTSWEGTEGVGQVEDLFTHPAYRHRGVATALIHQGVADCRARGAVPVVIVADPSDTPKEMYAAMGFRQIALRRSWRKDISQTT
jgi:ribosomal protein S18 acetylase RimI-like enzyme